MRGVYAAMIKIESISDMSKPNFHSTMIANEDNSDLPEVTSEVTSEITPTKPVKVIPSWQQKPLCNWTYFSPDHVRHPSQRDNSRCGIVIENIPAECAMMVLDRLKTLYTEESGLGELVRHLNPQLMATSAVTQGFSSLHPDVEVLQRANLFFTVKDSTLDAVTSLFNTVFIENILPYLRVHGWSIPPHFDKHSQENANSKRIYDQLPSSNQLREMSEALLKLAGSDLGRELMAAYIREARPVATQEKVHFRVQGMLTVTVGDNQEGLVRSHVQIDSYFHQPISAPVLFYPDRDN